MNFSTLFLNPAVVCQAPKLLDIQKIPSILGAYCWHVFKNKFEVCIFNLTNFNNFLQHRTHLSKNQSSVYLNLDNFSFFMHGSPEFPRET